MHNNTPASPALPWATSMALDLKVEPRPKTGLSRPKKAASAKIPAAMSPNSPAGTASPIGQPFSIITTISSVAKPNKTCTPMRTVFRLPRMRSKTRLKPRNMVTKGRMINREIGISAPSQKDTTAVSVHDNLQNMSRAMPASRSLITLAGHRDPVARISFLSHIPPKGRGAITTMGDVCGAQTQPNRQA